MPDPDSQDQPIVADDRDKRLDPRSISAARVQGGITLAVLAATTLIGTLVFAFFGPFGRLGVLLLPAAWLMVVAALTAFVLLWPPVRYRHTSYRVSDVGIRIQRGVVWRASISVPRTRVQHTDVSQGPIDRAFDLATLIIYTAGTQHASVQLSGLEHGTALAVRDHLIAGDDVDAV